MVLTSAEVQTIAAYVERLKAQIAELQEDSDRQTDRQREREREKETEREREREKNACTRSCAKPIESLPCTRC